MSSNLASATEERAARLAKEEEYHRKHDKKWWIALIMVVVGSFGVLLWMGQQINLAKPPIPTKVTVASSTLMTGDDIKQGQAIWQSMGGQEVGSVWGHGAYVAPDWTADYLHREATFILDAWASDEGAPSYDEADVETQAALKARLKQLLRTNTHDAATGTVTLDPIRQEAYEANVKYYTDLFINGHEHFAIQKNSLHTEDQARLVTDFFFWTSWSASTNAPNLDITYTQNWPHEPLIDNVPPPSNLMWSLVSIILLLAGIAGMIYYHTSMAEKVCSYLSPAFQINKMPLSS